jgi:hypothetical protein
MNTHNARMWREFIDQGACIKFVIMNYTFGIVESVVVVES